MGGAPSSGTLQLNVVPILDEHSSQDTIDRARLIIEQHGLAVSRSVIPRQTLSDLKQYLAHVGAASLPNWQPIRFGAPNFHRINASDPRSHVPGRFHQFNFFPWNQDIFDLFEVFQPIFRTRNLLLGESPQSFLAPVAGDLATARISIQFYPSGQGGMAVHKDPKGFHQRVLATVIMSKHGVDYHKGGLVMERHDALVFPELACDVGDVLWFDPQIPHGVKPIDMDSASGWLSFRGRWVALCATNALEVDSGIGKSVEVGAQGNAATEHPIERQPSISLKDA